MEGVPTMEEVDRLTGLLGDPPAVEAVGEGLGKACRRRGVVRGVTGPKPALPRARAEADAPGVRGVEKRGCRSASCTLGLRSAAITSESL